MLLTVVSTRYMLRSTEQNLMIPEGTAISIAQPPYQLRVVREKMTSDTSLTIIHMSQTLNASNSITDLKILALRKV